jgi:hypothetical protein
MSDIWNRSGDPSGETHLGAAQPDAIPDAAAAAYLKAATHDGSESTSVYERTKRGLAAALPHLAQQPREELRSTTLGLPTKRECGVETQDLGEPLGSQQSPDGMVVELLDDAIFALSHGRIQTGLERLARIRQRLARFGADQPHDG